MLKWLPWRYIVRRAARAYGVIDPVMALARLRRFAEPSEVQEPLELLRAGIVFHSRGLVNTRAIQHNLDWIWPYWIVKQFDPDSPSFIPRGFSFSHINLTHRNWTAVGLPHCDLYPIVDPRGLITPLFDGWSLDFWIRDTSGKPVMFPSRLPSVEQHYVFEPNLAVETIGRNGFLGLRSRVEVVLGLRQPILSVSLIGEGPENADLIVALRPYNPEGIQFIEDVRQLNGETPGWNVNNQAEVRFSERPRKWLFSTYAKGDVAHHLDDTLEPVSGHCRVGMATAAAFFPVGKSLEITVPLGRELKELGHTDPVKNHSVWSMARSEAAGLIAPNDRICYLFECAVHSLMLHSASEIYPGPYTYRRFWFRDACIILQALLALGLERRCRRIVLRFPTRQTRSGYFESQEGEWDSNGQVLWIAARIWEHTRELFPEPFLRSLVSGARWIRHKRCSRDKGRRHFGLLPAGFSAEHLGPNDYYFWDDFWAVGGLRDVAAVFLAHGMPQEAEEAQREAEDLMQSVSLAIEMSGPFRRRNAIPASPYRRMDAGAVGSLVADYPLQIYPAGDQRILNTADYLQSHCFRRGGFFQDMVHSGINAYLTLSIAQTYLRAGSNNWPAMMLRTAELASDTGQWPEAIHPATGGGCMGDGHHVWASAEWVMMLRNMFVREESGRLILGSGILPQWMDMQKPLAFGPTPTRWGRVKVSVSWSADTAHQSHPVVAIDAQWHCEPPPQIDVALPGFITASMNPQIAKVTLRKLV